MKRRICLALVVTAACHGAETSSRPRPPVEAAPVRDARLIDGDLHGFEPSDDLVAWASRLGDLTDRAKAAEELKALPPDRRVAVLRAGIRLRDATAARTCAELLLWNELDDWEQGLTSRLLTDAVVDPDFRDARGDVVTFADFFERVSGAEIPYVVDRVLASPPRQDDAAALAILHKCVSAEQIPDVARLTSSPDPEVRRHAFDMLLCVTTHTDQHREDVAAALLGITVEEARRRFPDVGDRLPPALVAVLRIERMPFEEKEPPRHEFRNWAWRWLADCRPSRDDVDFLLALDAQVPGGMQGRDCIPWILKTTDDPRIDPWLRATDAVSPMRAAALVVRRDRDAVKRLAERAETDELALNLLLAVAPDEGRALVERRVFDDDPEKADAALRDVREAWTRGATATGVAFNETIFFHFDGVCIRRKLDGPRLAKIGVCVPECRTRALAEAAVAALPRDRAPGEAGRSSFAFGDDVAAFLETGAPDAFRSLLRDWAKSSDEPTREAALDLLLRLGDPPSGPLLVAAIRADKLTPEPLSRLARSACPEVLAYLRARAEEDFRAAVACGVAAGMPERVGLEAFCLDESFPVEARDEVRRMLAAGRWKQAVAWALRSAPDPSDPSNAPLLGNVHLVDDDFVRAYLRRLQERRELGLYPWATAELAFMGDWPAHEEFLRAMETGRYRWIDENPQIAFPSPLPALDWWIFRMETNCCRLSTIRCYLFDHWFDLRFQSEEGEAPTTPYAEARRWYDRCGGRFVESRLAAVYGATAFVPAPR